MSSVESGATGPARGAGSAGFGAPAHAGDTGLLSPVSAGTAVERATGDLAVLSAMLEAETALARAQARLGLIPESAAAAVASCARVERFDCASLADRAPAGGNPVIGLVSELTSAVSEAFPESGHWVHYGATSQDILDTAQMLVAARGMDLMLGDLRRVVHAAATLTRTHRDAVMAGRTLTQHAVPTTFGRRVAGWLAGLLDAAERLARVRALLPAQLGGAAGTLAPFGAAGVHLMEIYAAECGLACPDIPWHTVRTPVADLAAALAHTAGALGKVAADIGAMARTEVAEVQEAAGGGSSAMPHKHNPVRATLILAASRQVPGLAGNLQAAMVAEDERPAGAWHAEWQPLRETLRVTGGATAHAAELLQGLQVDTARMRENLGITGGQVVTERVAAALMPSLGRAGAQRRVREVSLRAAEKGRELREVLQGQGDLVELLGSRAIDELCDPAGYTGSAGALADRVLERYRGSDLARTAVWAETWTGKAEGFEEPQ